MLKCTFSNGLILYKGNVLYKNQGAGQWELTPAKPALWRLGQENGRSIESCLGLLSETFVSE